MSISFDDETFDKLRGMRNSSDFVRKLVHEALEGEKEPILRVCEYCDKEVIEGLMWEGNDERWICEKCFNRKKRAHVLSGKGVFE